MSELLPTDLPVGFSCRPSHSGVTPGKGPYQNFRFLAHQAGMTTVFYPDSRIYSIFMLLAEPDARKHDLGKRLLHLAWDHALQLEATTMLASIISRECLEAMTSVFGEEHLDVRLKGSFATQGRQFGRPRTEAFLQFPVVPKGIGSA